MYIFLQIAQTTKKTENWLSCPFLSAGHDKAASTSAVQPSDTAATSALLAIATLQHLSVTQPADINNGGLLKCNCEV